MSAVAEFGGRISGVARKIPTWPVYVLGLLPGLYILWQVQSGAFFIDPVASLEHEFGLLSLQFLLGSLTISPVFRFARINLLKFRKALGLLAFGYLTLHFLTWLLLDLQLRWGQIGGDIVKRPYLTVGFIAFILLMPLVVTSTKGAIKRLGAQTWARIHRLVYVVVLLGAVHFIMQEKVWTPESLAYLAITLILLACRFAWIRRW